MSLGGFYYTIDHNQSEVENESRRRPGQNNK